MLNLGYNYLLDKLPMEYMGYPIRTNFTVGIKLNNILESSNLNEYQKYEYAIRLLYKEIPDDLSVAIEGIEWFLYGGRESDTESNEGEYDEFDDKDDEVYDDVEYTDEEESVRSFDFGVDSKEIYTAFRRTYNINLHKEYVHWFDFLAMLSDLDECNFTNIVEIRTKSLRDLSDAEKRYYLKMKSKYKLPPTAEEIQIAKEMHGNRMIDGKYVWKSEWLGCWFYGKLE